MVTFDLLKRNPIKCTNNKNLSWAQFGALLALCALLLGAVSRQSSIDNYQDRENAAQTAKIISLEKNIDKIDKKLDYLIELQLSIKK